MKLGDYLKEEREKKGLLMRQLGSLIDVDTSLISKIEKGERIPTLEQVSKLSNVLNINEKELKSYWLSEKIFSLLPNDKDVFEKAIELVNVELKKGSNG